jgi:phosphatidylinositol kinase/protein kinase (PI-3  family)
VDGGDYSHKPVLGAWYALKFPHPAAWFQARLAYARSAAVMSMVGAMIGYVTLLSLFVVPT